MFRSTFLALAATAGLMGGTEFTGNTAKAQAIVGVRVGRVGVVIGGPRVVYHGPICAQPIVVVRPAPIVVVPAPIVVVPVCHQYDVLYRGCPTEGWRLYGTFASDFRAREVMAGLQSQGLQASEAVR